MTPDFFFFFFLLLLLQPVMSKSCKSLTIAYVEKLNNAFWSSCSAKSTKITGGVWKMPRQKVIEQQLFTMLSPQYQKRCKFPWNQWLTKVKAQTRSPFLSIRMFVVCFNCNKTFVTIYNVFTNFCVKEKLRWNQLAKIYI